MMTSRSREKIALLVFALLAVLSLCGLCWYLFAGHSWNVAASNIDDTFGSMDGYTAIVYEGTVDPAEKAAAPKAADGSDASAEGSSAAGADDTDGAAGAVDALGPDGAGAQDAASPEDGAGVESSAVDEPADGASAPDDSSSPDGTAASDNAAAASSTSASSSSSSGASGVLATGKEHVTVDEVRASYVEKQACVLVLDTANPSRYEEPTILKRGSHRFGVFSVDEDSTPRGIKRAVDYLKDHAVDYVVVLTSDTELLEGAEGIDIAVSTVDEGLFVMGETIGGTFYVDAPEIGSVGAILISPSNVVSAKVIESL